MRISIRRDLGLQLLALYLLFVGPVVIALLVLDWFTSQQIEADAKAADLALARAIAQETNTTLDHAQLAVKMLSEYPEVIQVDYAGMERLFGTVMSARPDINLVYRLDSDGTMLFHYPLGPGSTVGDDFSFREYYQRALDSEDPLLSQGRISPTTEEPVTTAVMPLRDDRDLFLGLVATNIKLQSLSNTLESIIAEHRANENFEVLILDQSGHVIAHPDPTYLLDDLSLSLSQITTAVLSGESGNLIDTNQNNEEMLYSFVPIPSAGWGVIVNRPTAEAFATARATHHAALLAVGIFLSVGIVSWIVLSRRVIQPLERLAVFSQRIGLEANIQPQRETDLNLLAQRSDQIGHLIRSMTRMEEAIEARLNELSTLLETSAAVVSTLDRQEVLDSILEQVERLMDIHMSAILALDESRGMFRIQASRGLSRRYAEQLSISPNEPLSVSMRAIRSGEPIQVSDVETDATFSAIRPRALSEGYRSVIAVPLKTQHAPPAALLVYRPDPHVFNKREINLLTNFANHAAMAIENAALYARSDMRLKEQTRRLEALIQSLHDGLVLEDLSGSVLYANRRIGELVDMPLEEIIGFRFNKLMEKLLSKVDDKQNGQGSKIQHEVEDALNGKGPRQVEMQISTNQQKRVLRLRVFDVTDPEGLRIGRGQILRDITRFREIDRMKSSLISTVSHELRTPLASIKGYATTLLAEDVTWDSHAQREFLNIISDETDRLGKMVNDLLDMSRIESGNLDVKREVCSLEELIYRAAQRAYPAPEDRLQIELSNEIPSLYVDPHRIEAVIRNLIENATKYAGDHTPISIRGEILNGNLIVRVIDEGPGIPQENSREIFESFYQMENGLSRSYPGAGLGLAICRGFINAHGGEIWLEPHKGACFAFSLPLNSNSAAFSPENDSDWYKLYE